jgi:hypothetical protein
LERRARATAKWVEEAANGPAVLSALRERVSGLIGVPPRFDKMTRAMAEAPTVEAHEVVLPHPSIAPWVHDYIEELAVFPNGANTDQGDATSLALNRIRAWHGRPANDGQRYETHKAGKGPDPLMTLLSEFEKHGGGRPSFTRDDNGREKTNGEPKYTTFRGRR